jgi:hypothetical protein
LLEGNALTQIYADSVWGTSSQTTAYRNWVIGTNHICAPASGRGTVSCSGAIYGFQAVRAMQWSYLATLNNFVGNVVGSSQMQSLVAYGTSTMGQVASVEYPANRSYDADAYGWSFGYGESADDGSGGGDKAGTSATDLITGNFNNIGGTIAWAASTLTLPASFYQTSKPSWWGSIPYPATGPDVTGGSGPGGHTYGNPAYQCFVNVMHGTDGGAGGPYNFNANTCYGNGVTPGSPTNLTGTVVPQ